MTFAVVAITMPAFSQAWTGTVETGTVWTGTVETGTVGTVTVETVTVYAVMIEGGAPTWHRGSSALPGRCLKRKRCTFGTLFFWVRTLFAKSLSILAKSAVA